MPESPTTHHVTQLYGMTLRQLEQFLRSIRRIRSDDYTMHNRRNMIDSILSIYIMLSLWCVPVRSTLCIVTYCNWFKRASDLISAESRPRTE